MASFIKRKTIDRIYRLPRIWSNNELKKFAHLFKGDIVNVSGWQDKDKEGNEYKNYFINASSYTITNFKSEMRGIQGYENEIFLDLEEDLPNKLNNKFDVVFNHTTLEHVYDFHKAFENLCKLSKDIVIIVVPFLQEMHGEYGDFWRFSPQALDKMFKSHLYKLLYLSYNDHKNASVYIFAIASRISKKWDSLFDKNKLCLNPALSLGANVYKNKFL